MLRHTYCGKATHRSPPLTKATRHLLGVTTDTISARALSTSSLMNTLLSPPLCNNTFTTSSRSCEENFMQLLKTQYARYQNGIYHKSSFTLYTCSNIFPQQEKRSARQEKAARATCDLKFFTCNGRANMRRQLHKY